MFTGLVEDVGELLQRSTLGRAGKLEARSGLPVAEFAVGDSVAVNGVCLTVEEVRSGPGTLVFHTLAETLKRTNLGGLSIGAPVNLERALLAGARFGGHFVMGHIDTTSRIQAIGRPGDDYVVRVQLPESLRAFVIPKGSIAINGISLTIADLAADAFSVSIIPHTWTHTNLSAAKAGDHVNLEADMLGKYILRWQQVEAGRGGVTMDGLSNAGFVA